MPRASVPPFRPRGRRARRLLPSFAATAASLVVPVLGAPAWAEPIESGDQATPCRADQIAVAAGPPEAAVGHRSVTLTFSLAGGAVPCTLTGYPWVDSGAGGERIHADATPRGYMGGLPPLVDAPSTATLSIVAQAQAIVESMAVDDAGNPCPTYTDLLVNPPDTGQVFTVPATIEACALQVHPITALGG